MQRGCSRSSSTNAAQPGSPSASTRGIRASAVPDRQPSGAKVLGLLPLQGEQLETLPVTTHGVD